MATNSASAPSPTAPNPIIAVVGNPNCGKSTLFNALTGSTQAVGNWPGVTVEKRVGRYAHAGVTYDLVDLPGVYLIGHIGAGSEDERVARDYVLSGEADLVVDIIDASNLERNLYLTSQLLELGVPVIVVLNMLDMAKLGGVSIDAEKLSALIGCPVVTMIASRGDGCDRLKAAIATAIAMGMSGGRRPTARPEPPKEIAAAIDLLAPELAAAANTAKVDPRWVALKLLEGDDFAEALAGDRIGTLAARARRDIEAATGDECDILIADGRYRFIGGLMAECHRHTQRLSASLTQMIDRVALNKWLGVPLFLFAMYLMFLFTIAVGGAFVDVFDQSFKAIAVDGLGDLLASVGAPDWLTALAKGFGSGIQTVSTFVPIIACLFLFLSFLEDSGYMARAAFVMDRAMRAIGLPGKSFVPLIVGFGCNVPAIMATRTLESRRDRILTVLMAPFMSCGARLPVFALFAAAFFPSSGQNIVFLLYLVGLAYAVITGLILKSTLLPGEATHFVMELPPYHLPTVRAVLRQAWHRLREFIFNAGQVIVPMVMVLTVLSSIGTDGSFGKEDTKDSVLAALSRAVVPVFHPIGVTDENWPAAVGLFSGVFAKEAVVGTLNALYAQAGAEDANAAPDAAEEAPKSLADKLVAAFETVPDNLGKLGSALLDPLGLHVANVADAGAAAEELKVNDRTFGAMQSRFDGVAGAFAYMLLILLYTPCVASTGAIRHEIGTRWMIFATAWTTGLGYISSVAFYQIATFDRHPTSSAEILVVCAIVVIAAFTAMRSFGRQQIRRLAAAAGE